MSATTVYELIGYIASALIVISLAMSSIIKLRVINLVGAITFTVYGFLIGSLPVALTNIIIAGLDIWYLRKELTTREELSVIGTQPGDRFLAAFLDVFGDDLESFVQPEESLRTADVWFVMLRNATAAGVFAGRSDGSDLHVLVDYVAPPYRDHKSGTQLYVGQGRRFRDAGFERLVLAVPDGRQADYLSSMGYVRDANGSMALNVTQQ